MDMYRKDGRERDRKKSDIAVIIVNYNGAKDTIACLKSIEESTVLVDVFVVDNASGNNDIEEITREFPNINMITNTENLGFAGGNNLGIRCALDRGYEYITLLNNDTIVDKNMFSQLSHFASKNMAVLPVMYYYDMPEKIWYAGGIIDKKTGIVRHVQQTDNSKQNKQYCEFATGCCMMLHREIIETAGMLDDNFFMYCEDEEYSLRLAKHNIKIAVISKAKLWHKVAQSSKKGSPFFEYYISRNRMLCIKKYREDFRKTAYLYSTITRIVKMTDYFIRRDERYKSCMYAVIDAFKEQYIKRY